MHLTIKFLGQITEDQAKNVINILNDLNMAEFQIKIYGIGAFPSIKRPSVVWAGVTEGGDKLTEMWRLIEGRLTRLGFERDKRRFHPHLTIARVKWVQNPSQLSNYLLKYSTLEFGESVIDAVKLKKSVLTSEGPIYSDVYVKSFKS